MDFKEIIATLQQFGSIRKIHEIQSQPLVKAEFVNNKTIYNDKTLYFLSAPLHPSQPLPPFCVLGEEDIYQDFSCYQSNQGTALVEAKNLQIFFNHAKRLLTPDKKIKQDSNWLPVIENLKDLNEIANTAATIFNNSVIIMDIHHRVLSYSTVYPINDIVLSDIIQKGYLPYQNILDAESPDFLLAPNNGEPVTLTCWASPLRKLCSKIVFEKDGDWLGYIVMIEEETQIDAFHIDWIPLISRAASKVLARDPFIVSMKKSLHSKVLYELIIGAQVTDINNTLKELDLLTVKNRCVIVVEAIKPIAQEVLYVKLPQLLADFLPSSYFTYHENCIIILIEEQAENYFKEEKIANLSLLKEKYHLGIGISSSFDQITHFRQHYLQARKAIQLAQHFGEETVAEYDDYSFYDLLSHVKVGPGENLSDFCHPAIKKLQEYDYFHQTELGLTLRTYLEYAGSLKTTAQQLFIHRNTLLYRLDRIKELLKLDLDNPSLRFHLLASYHIEKFSQPKKKLIQPKADSL